MRDELSPGERLAGKVRSPPWGFVLAVFVASRLLYLVAGTALAGVLPVGPCAHYCAGPLRGPLEITHGLSTVRARGVPPVYRARAPAQEPVGAGGVAAGQHRGLPDPLRSLRELALRGVRARRAHDAELGPPQASRIANPPSPRRGIANDARGSERVKTSPAGVDRRFLMRLLYFGGTLSVTGSG